MAQQTISNDPYYIDLRNRVTNIETTYLNIYEQAMEGALAGVAGQSGVSTFNGRSGTVTLTQVDVTNALTYIPTSITGLTGVQSIATLKTGLAITKSDVGLANVDNTSDATKAVLSAGKLTTARNINGVAFDGTAAITINAVDSTARLAAASNLSDLVNAGTARTNLGLAIGTNVQAWDADLDALAAVTGTNTIYYRSAANMWSPVTFSGISFSGGQLSVTASGTGTVTSVSVITGNGVSATVTNPTTTPALAFTLGAITPSSVAATGTVTGSNLSGTNTGDQTRSGLGAAASGANTDITSLGGLTTPLSIAQGGTSGATAAAARTALGLVQTGTGTANPTVTTDSSAGYAAGSTYTNTTTGVLFVCRVATAGSAVWERVTAPEFPGYISGNWYASVNGASIAAGGSAMGASLFMSPIWLYERVTLNSLAIRVATLSASGNTMIGIYGHNYTTGRPTGNVLAGVTGLSTTATGLVSAALASNVTLEPGLYWVASEADNTTARYVIVASATAYGSALVGSPTLADLSSSSTNATFALSVTNTYGTFPDLTSATFTATSSQSAFLFFKVA